MYPFQVSDSLPPQLGLGWSRSIKLSLELSYPSNYILYLILCFILPVALGEENLFIYFQESLLVFTLYLKLLINTLSFSLFSSHIFIVLYN